MIAALLASGILFLAAPAADATPVPPSPPAAPTAPASPTTVSGSLSIFGGDFTIPADEVRQGDVTIYGGSGDVLGTVTHDLRVFGGSVNVDGSIGHDVVIFGGSVHLGPHATVGHDVTAVGGSMDRDPGARVGHTVSEGGFSSDALAGFLPSLPHLPHVQPFRGFDLQFGLGVALGVVLLALLLQLFFPRQVATTRDALEERPFASLGFGCLTAVAGVLLAALLGVTVILLPASLAIAVAMTAGWLLGLTGAIVLIGQRLTGAFRLHLDPVPTLLLGGVLVAVLVNVPFLGGLFGLLIGSMALGAVVLTRFGTRPHPPAPPPYAGGFPPAPTEAPR